MEDSRIPAMAIFYDLETTSLNVIGQITNFCFIAVDPNWNEIARISGIVKISPLQLPAPGAIEATKTNIEEHQLKADLTEKQAAHLIYTFLLDMKARCESGFPALVGYNSADFDLEYLRTVLIRNGYSPYQLFESKDLLFVSRYLFSSREDFRRVIPPKVTDGKERLSLRLEHIAKSLNLLEGEQLHESCFDVELSIRLAQYYQQRFKVDVREFQAYGLSGFQSDASEPILVSEFRQSLVEPVRNSWKLFLQKDGNAALWLDLESLSEDVKLREDALSAVKRYKIFGHLAWCQNKSLVPPEIRNKSLIAKQLLGRVDASELFEESTCYIEQFIYRIPPNHHTLLFKSIAHGTIADASLPSDVITLTRRHWLENCPETERSGDTYRAAFKAYAIYRYGGKLKLRNNPKKEGKSPNIYHPTLRNLLKEITERSKKSNNLTIMESLQRFYMSSDVMKFAGDELLRDPGVEEVT